jgi:hypothetical protein
MSRRDAIPAPIKAAWISSDGSVSVPEAFGAQAGSGGRRGVSGNWEERRNEREQGGATRPPSWNCLEALSDIGSLFNVSCNHSHKGARDGSAAGARPDDSVAAARHPGGTRDDQGRVASRSECGGQQSRDAELDYLRSERDGLREQLESTELKRQQHSSRVLEMATYARPTTHLL